MRGGGGGEELTGKFSDRDFFKDLFLCAIYLRKWTY